MAMIGRRKPMPPYYAPIPAPDLGQGPVGLNAAPLAAMTPQTPQAPDAALVAAPHDKINWLGVLADALSGAAGMPGQYAQNMMQQKREQTALERGEQQYQRQRRDSLADDERNYKQQMGLLDYKRAHPDDDLTTYLDRAGITDPTERQGYFRRKADAATAPPMMSAQGVDEQGNPVMRFFPRAPSTGASGAPPIGTIKGGHRFIGGDPGNPASWQAVGGQTPPASGGFPG